MREVDEWLRIDGNYQKNIRRPRIYLINGINYNGDATRLEHFKRMVTDAYGPNVEVVVVEDHPYDSNLAQFNPFRATIWGTVAQIPLQGINTIYNIVQVAREYITGSSTETDKVYQWIMDDLAKNGLLGEGDLDVILVGHSGGGAIAANMAGRLEQNAYVNVSGVVALGSPLVNVDQAAQYAETVLDIRHEQDNVATLFGLGQLRSDEGRIVAPALALAALANPPLAAITLPLIDDIDTVFRDNLPGIQERSITTGTNLLITAESTTQLSPHSAYFASCEVVSMLQELVSKQP